MVIAIWDRVSSLGLYISVTARAESLTYPASNEH